MPVRPTLPPGRRRQVDDDGAGVDGEAVDVDDVVEDELEPLELDEASPVEELDELSPPEDEVSEEPDGAAVRDDEPRLSVL
jgi:hypothetical protein